MYANIRNLLFKMDPEKAHTRTIHALKMMQSFSVARNMYNKNMRLNDSRLECKLLDITFPNPMGLTSLLMYTQLLHPLDLDQLK
ncbi:putative dihydroorotate dehydrogenase (plasmid) [Bacillus cereus E33L]|nr:putative dihydroorotate dehydrogenase [Bacillus cereus E33L]